MRKKLFPALCLLLALVMAASLAGCGQSKSGGLGTLTMKDGTTVSNSGKAEATGGEDKTAPPEDTPAPTPEPESLPEGSAEESGPDLGQVTEQYTCDEFTMAIPKGWQVTGIPYGDDNAKQLLVFVTNPGDPNNHIFFASSLEPLFTSAEDKKTWEKSVSGLEWAPVLSAVTAEEMMNNWGAIYTMIQADGSGFDRYFKNYRVQKVMQAAVSPNSTDQMVSSELLCEVSIPASKEPYVMYFYSNLCRISTGGSLPDYYSGQGNRGICMSKELYEDQIDVLAYCLSSLDLSGFNQKYPGSMIG